MNVRKSITIERPAEQLFRFWRSFENLPRFMIHLEAVRPDADGRSHWIAKAPVGTTVEWDAEIIEERPNEMIAWRSVANAEVPNRGVVRFEPATGGRGTVVRVEMDYDPPGGAIGSLFAKLLGEEPDVQLRDDLRRFKQVMETGEIVRSDSTLEGAGASYSHPTRPPAPDEMRA
jgi:uncharacterized membrane protein